MSDGRSKIDLIDTHCHIQDSEFFGDKCEEAYRQSVESGVRRMLVVGTSERSSEEAVEFAMSHKGCFAIVGIHPHEAKVADSTKIRDLLERYKTVKSAKKRAKDSLIAGIGEIGLDYHYSHSSRDDQMRVLREQLEIAREFDLPVSFHVREAFDDFWMVLADFPDVKGVVHSFTDTQENADIALRRGFYIGVNGISTFTKDEAQKQLYANLPIDKILIETDAPFLTPAPFRGKMNIPAYVGRVAEVQAELKGLSVSEVAQITTRSAEVLFNLKEEN